MSTQTDSISSIRIDEYAENLNDYFEDNPFKKMYKGKDYLS